MVANAQRACHLDLILLGQNPELIHPSHRSLNSLRRRPRRRSPRRRRPHAAVAYAAAAHAAATHATAARDAAARVTEAHVAAARAAAVRTAAARAAAITLARATTAHGRNSRRSSPHRHSPRQRSPRRHRPRRRSPRLSQPANSKPAPPEPTPPPLLPRRLQGSVWQHQASSACHRFSGAAPNQEWRDQFGPARLWPTYQQNLSLFFARAPHISSAAPEGAMQGPPQAPKKIRHLAKLPISSRNWAISRACQLAVRANTCSISCSLQPAQHCLRSASLPNTPIAQWTCSRRAAAR